MILPLAEEPRRQVQLPEERRSEWDLEISSGPEAQRFIAMDLSDISLLRRVLAAQDEQLAAQCAFCAEEEEKLLRASYASELKEIKREAQREGESYDFKLRISEVLEAHQEEERELLQQLRLREEDIARNEQVVCHTVQEHLAADLKKQLAASQEKAALLEHSVECTQLLVFQKEQELEELLENFDGLKIKAQERDAKDVEEKALQRRNKRLDEQILEMKRLQTADFLTADLNERLITEGELVADVAAAAEQLPKAPREQLAAEKLRLEERKRLAKKETSEMEAKEMNFSPLLVLWGGNQEVSRGITAPKVRKLWWFSECVGSCDRLRSKHFESLPQRKKRRLANSLQVNL